VRQGGQPQPLEHWVEDLYRRVSDRQTMGSVVGELRGTLGELEKVLDQFFRNPPTRARCAKRRTSCADARRAVGAGPGPGLAGRAAHARHGREHHGHRARRGEGRAAGTFEKLGNNLGALGFLIDMLNYQPALAKKLFVWDDVKGELRR
jgi:chemosensory pili system protein ChpA (sensor histidine kinase/response regulator)